MTDDILALIAANGTWIVALTTFLSCLALPVPASLAMIGGGAFAASGDLGPATVAGAALVGAVLGDQAGFQLGRRGAGLMQRLQSGASRHAGLWQRTERLIHERGGAGVFLSRWLFSPLGPYVNYFAGAARLNWLRFTLWGLAGEIVWVAAYTGLGFAFSGQITMIADLAGNLSGLLAAAAMAGILGWFTFRRGDG